MRDDYMTVRPHGCHCETWAQAERCFEWCYQTPEPRTPSRLQKFLQDPDTFETVLGCIALWVFLSCALMVAHKLTTRDAPCSVYEIRAFQCHRGPA